jgi:hypothetical protein
MHKLKVLEAGRSCNTGTRLLTGKRVDKCSFHSRIDEERADGASGSVEDIREVCEVA